MANHILERLKKSKLYTVDKYPVLAVTLVTTVSVFILFNSLVWDDVYLLKNFEGFQNSSLFHLLTVPFWQNSSYAAAELPSYWRPLTTFVFWLVSHLKNSEPWTFHFASLLGSFFASVAFYKVLISVSPNAEKGAFWLSVLYFIHPITIEVTCMAANIADHLALVFLFLALSYSIEYARKGKKKHLWLIFVASLLSCFSKEFGVLSMGIPILVGLLSASKNAEGKRSLQPRIMLHLVSATILPGLLFLTLRYFVLDSASNNGIQLFRNTFSLPGDLVFLSLGQSFWQSIVLAPKGAHLYLSTHSILAWTLSAAVVITLFVALFLAYKKKQLSISLIFLLILIPFIIPSLFGVVKDNEQYIIPLRYFHLPLISLLASTLPFVQKVALGSLKPALLGAVILLSLVSWNRISEWKNERSLFESEVAHHPTSTSDVKNLSEAYIRNQNYAKALDVILDFRSQTQPQSRHDEALTYSILSKIAFYKSGNIETSTQLIQKALQSEPQNLSNVFWFAEIRSYIGRPDQSIMILNDALKMPWYTPAQKKKIKTKILYYKNYP